MERVATLVPKGEDEAGYGERWDFWKIFGSGGTISILFSLLPQITKVTTTDREATMTFSPTGRPPKPSPRPTPATFRTQDPAPHPWDPWSPL